MRCLPLLYFCRQRNRDVSFTGFTSICMLHTLYFHHTSGNKFCFFTSGFHHLIMTTVTNDIFEMIVDYLNCTLSHRDAFLFFLDDFPITVYVMVPWLCSPVCTGSAKDDSSSKEDPFPSGIWYFDFSVLEPFNILVKRRPSSKCYVNSIII